MGGDLEVEDLVKINLTGSRVRYVGRKGREESVNPESGTEMKPLSNFPARGGRGNYYNTIELVVNIKCNILRPDLRLK